VHPLHRNPEVLVDREEPVEFSLGNHGDRGWFDGLHEDRPVAAQFLQAIERFTRADHTHQPRFSRGIRLRRVEESFLEHVERRSTAALLKETLADR
jgi:hypothetical protein